MKRFIFGVFLSVLVLGFSGAAIAQNTAGVTGSVTDTTGAVIAGADVKLTDTKTGTEQSTKTSDQGVYSFLRLAPGQGFTLTFTATGFQTLVLKNVALGVGVTETHNAQLTVGQVSTTVEITSSGEATLNTVDASIGNVIESRRLSELPIQIRSSPAALIGLQPGVVGNNVGTTTTNRVGSVTGSRADQGNITVDGIDANDQATGQFAATVGNAPIDAIQEFRAVSTNPAASEGRSSGGQVELVTKPGTNQFHGNVREYNRTAATAANSFFNNKNGTPRPQLTRNQYGGSIGGPIKKDKAFFFFDFEGRWDAQGVSYTRIVPLAPFRSGGLSFLNGNAGCPTNARLDNPATASCITTLTPAQVAALDPKHVGASAGLLSFINSRYPVANTLSAGDGINTGGFSFNAPSKRKDKTFTNRVDWNVTDKQKMFGRWNIARRLQTDTVNSVAEQFPGDPETAQIVVRDYAWVVGHTWIASDSVVNQATVGVSRSGLLFPNNFHPAAPNSFAFGAGLTAPFASISDQDRFVNVPTIRDDLTWTKGTHSFAFGASFKPIVSKSGLTNDFNFPTVGLGGLLGSLDNTLRPGTTNIGTVTCAGNPACLGTGTTRSGNYDSAFAFLLGRYASIATNFNYGVDGNAFAPGTGKHRDYRYNEYELYMQDNWKMRSDLTLTYGVRWHFYPAPYEKDGFQAAQDIDMRNLVNLRQRNAAAGISGVAAEPFLRYDLVGKGNDGRSLYDSDLNNFGPRFGVSYNPSFKSGVLGKVFGDRKTVLRGGGSVVYDRPGGAITFIQDQVSYLFDNSATTQFPVVDPTSALLNNPRFTNINTLPVNNVAPVITHPSTPFINNPDCPSPSGLCTGEFNYAVDQQFKTPYSIQYSIGFQRELPGNFILDMSYVGRQGRKLFSQADIAQALNFRDPTSGQLMFDAFNLLQNQVNAGLTGAAITKQPWFENQIGAGGTALMAGNGTLRQFVLRGDTSDAVQLLYANNLLDPNVGLSAQFGTNIYISNQGASSYDGMLVSLRKRFSQGLQFDFNYTWSHSIDNGSSVVNTVSGGLVCDVTNLRVCRGASDFDIRHLVNVNGIYELPFGRGHSRFLGGHAPGWLNAIIGGWEITGIFTARSGLPFSTTTTAFPVGFNFNSPAAFNGDASKLVGQIHNSGSTIQFFGDPLAVFNTGDPTKVTSGAIRFPHHGEIGNRNVFRGPGFWNVDTAFLKTFKTPWSEKQTVQIRWESYNLFNHNSFGLPNSSITSTAFGTITSSSSTPREMQFAIRYSF
jgi:hypothetical protein